MDLIRGRVYLCDVWYVPPGTLDCGFEEHQLALMVYNGRWATPFRARTITCGDATFELNPPPDGLMDHWVAYEELGHLKRIGPTWRVEAVREMVPDSPEADPAREMGL